jgi:hypothetical protein
LEAAGRHRPAASSRIGGVAYLGGSALPGTGIAQAGDAHRIEGPAIVGRILLGVVIGIVLVIWLLASCVGAIF